MADTTTGPARTLRPFDRIVADARREIAVRVNPLEGLAEELRDALHWAVRHRYPAHTALTVHTAAARAPGTRYAVAVSAPQAEAILSVIGGWDRPSLPPLQQRQLRPFAAMLAGLDAFAHALRTEASLAHDTPADLHPYTVARALALRDALTAWLVAVNVVEIGPDQSPATARRPITPAADAAAHDPRWSGVADGVERTPGTRSALGARNRRGG